MTAIVSLLLVISLSILITRIATVSLILTGLSRAAARFQARSALTGTGFTTQEAEHVVGHPLRRRIILFLMLIGNAGIITAVSALILGFVGTGETAASRWMKLGFLLAGICVLWFLARSQWVDRWLSRIIERALKRYTNLDARDYNSIMHLGGQYRIAELQVEPNDWLAKRTLANSRLRDEGIVVLGIERPDGTYLGTPKPDREIQPDDLLILYGRAQALERLDERKASPWAAAEHQQAVVEQKQVIWQQEKEDAVSKERTNTTDPAQNQ